MKAALPFSFARLLHTVSGVCLGLCLLLGTMHPARADSLPAGMTAADWQAISAQLPAGAKALSDGLSQRGYLKASNAGASDLFGYSVAISGDTVVVGAYQEDSDGSGPDDNSAPYAGAAYVFASPYRVSGSLSGLTGHGLELRNNGGDALFPAAGDTSFSFPTLLFDDATYAVSIATQPVGQTCTLSGDTGTIAGADVTSVAVTCAINQYTVTANASGGHGGITPPSQTVNHGDAASFTLTPTAGYHAVQPLGGDCPAGTLTGNSYVTGAITDACEVIASFAQNQAGGMSLVAGSLQTTDVGQAFAQALSVRVADANDVPLQGIQVNFIASPDASGASASLAAMLGDAGSASLAVPTDANGIAAVHASANAMAGDHTITASLPAFTLVPAATFSLSNARLAASLELSVFPATVASNQTATLSAALSGDDRLPFSGTVAFYMDGHSLCAAVPVNASGIATCVAGPFAAGMHQFTASYDGGGSHTPAQTIVAIGVNALAPAMVPVNNPWALAWLTALLSLAAVFLMPPSRR